jgi:1-phosphofructokinase family hexose kinase
VILCIAPNPAVDRTARVDRVVLDEILRPAEVLALAGGKAFNVARAAHLLGEEVITAGVAGGHAGRWLFARLGDEGLNPEFVSSDVETRTTYVVVGRDGHSVMVYEAGDPQPQSAFDTLLTLIRDRLLPRSSYVVIAGGVPPGIDARWVGDVLSAARDAGVPCLVDSRGDSLREALAARPAILKANEFEIRDTGLGADDASPLHLAREAVRMGAGACVVTLGMQGAIACDGGTSWRLEVPIQTPINTVGAGDAFTAGLVVALGRREPFESALLHGGAAAAASVLELGAGFLDPRKVSELAAGVRVQKIVA